MPQRFETGARSHIGRVREANEDGFIVYPAIGVWAVADGMGGHEGGRLASNAVIDALQTIGRPVSAANLLERLEDRIVRANRHIFDLARERGVDAIGTTLAALLVFGDAFAAVWCGDSRIYRVREAAIELLSHDHTELQDLLDNGLLSHAEASDWPRGHVVTRAIGTEAEPDLELESGTVRRGDRFVLCSDGLTGHVTDAEIRDLVLAHPPQAACDALVALTLERGASDNVTVIVVATE